MVSKKQALTLGLLAIGGIGVATMVSGGGDDDGGGGATMEGKRGRAGGILGSQSPGVPSVFKAPAEAAVTFPEQKDYTDFLARFLAPKEAVSRGTQGVSTSGKKLPSPATGVVPYRWTGGDIELGAYTPVRSDFAIAESIDYPSSRTVSAPKTTTPKKTATGLTYGSRSHTVSKTGMHTVTSVSKKGVVSKKAYRN